MFENFPNKKFFLGRAGSEDQVVECLLSKPEAQSSNPSTTKRKRKKEGRKEKRRKKE
jgi:hypothetical protein